MIAGVAAIVAAGVLGGGASVAGNPWSDGAPAPPPTQPMPYPQAPREPGADVEVLAVPPAPPEPHRPALVDGIVPPAPDPRFVTRRSRADLFAHGALDPDSALVDVPGLWLRHVQAGNARMLLRGLDDRDLDVVLDGVPLFDLGGLVPPLEQLANASTAHLALHHGAHAVALSPKGAAGVLDVDTLDVMRDEGEQLGLHGVLGAGYGGADLEKGVFTAVETGYGRAQLGLHATLLDREDQRLGRWRLADGQEPGGLLFASGGDGGALGARLDVVPMRRLHVFTTWHSSRALETPLPSTCTPNDAGNAADCTRTTERGLDVWIAGADGALDVAGVDLVARGRAHMQHGVANEERAGASLPFVDRALDDGVRAGGDATLEAVLPAVALGDVWTPRARLGVDVYADRFSSSFFSRSTRRVDAEPPGNGLPDPAKARLPDGAVAGYSALWLSLMAEGQRTTVWASGRVAESSADGGFLAGELGVRTRVVEALDAWATVVHLAHDDTTEVGLSFALPWLQIDGDVYGATRDAFPATAGTTSPADTVAYGTELRAALRPGVAGLAALGSLGVVAVDDGALFADKTPHPGVPNPKGTLELDWDPPLPGQAFALGFFSRAAFYLPQQALAPGEALDRGLCPELPPPEQLASGTAQQQPCSGAPGGFLFDLGAHLDVGAFRVDAAALNLLDQQFALRDEPIGFGGTSFRAMLTLAL